ncbi:metabolite traffic protein EboE [Solidesulfovibrio sp.]
MEPVTYCTNIHPGESWAEIRAGVLAHAPAVAAAVCPDRPFPLGLRLSGRASLEIDAAAARAFADEARALGLSFRTLNGFPYGRFHHTPVKESVYLPDWRDSERTAYTLRLARLLAGWLPEGETGTISTVPLGFARGFPEAELPTAYAAIRRTLAALAELHEETGRRIRLAVEAEPGCRIETTPQMAAFFARLDAPPAHQAHVCVCYDCCHQALQYEDPAISLGVLEAAGIDVGHVQVSSALHLEGGDLTRLARFVEPVYLHQAVARLQDGTLRRFDDLPQALAAGLDGVLSWRVHFHLPVFVGQLPDCGTTQPFLQAILPLFDVSIPMEVETYTWSVLPPELKMSDVTSSIIREIEWVERARRS